MAEQLVFPLNFKLHLPRDFVNNNLFLPENSRFGVRSRTRLTSVSRIFRKCYLRSCEAVGFPLRNARSLSSYSRNVEVHQVDKKSTTCCCLGAFINADNPITSEWIAMSDQILLMASAFLTYTAGVVPAKKMLGVSCKEDINDVSAPKNYSTGSSKEHDKEVNLQSAWDEVEVKLLDSMHAMKEEVAGNQVTGYKREVALQTLSLYALLERPRSRLMWFSFQWLKKEVDNLRVNYDFNSSEEQMPAFMCILQNSRQPLCLTWLEEELNINNSMQNTTFLSSLISKLSGEDSLLQYIKKLGKLDLYAEFIFALVSDSPRTNGYYDHSLFTQHGVALLEDLVITLANVIASMYLELLSVDSTVANEVTSLGLQLCTLSTRALQRIRNEVALHQWMHQNMESVVSMYEDRFELCTLESHTIQETECEAGNFNWLKNIFSRRSGEMLSPLSMVVISPVSIYVKRTKELRALTGWRYYFSLLLELGDIAFPVMRTVIAKVREAISFFLVCLIGRSLGLIYTGIRESLRWK